MSGFSAEWLALRELADHAARDKALLDEVRGHFAGRDHLSVVDLGSGAGSNLRGMATKLGVISQSWTLVDYDRDLLSTARARLAEWAESVEIRGEELVLTCGRIRITVDTRIVDLNTDLETVAGWRPDLVTAAAFFDLVSEPWIDRFCATLARHSLPLYTVLTYDGREEWSPAHDLDAAINDAFNAHQATDKGFGPAAGPKATDRLAREFASHGYTVATGNSPWRLSPVGDAELTRQLADGIANAARETGRFAPADVGTWRAAHGPDAAVRIGHLDLFATPPAR